MITASPADSFEVIQPPPLRLTLKDRMSGLLRLADALIVTREGLDVGGA